MRTNRRLKFITTTLFALALVFAPAGDISVLQNFAITARAAESGTCGENLTWILDKAGTLTISGTGAMTDFPYEDSPWYSSRANIKSVVISSGVESIGSSAFYGCTSLPSVDIPSSVTSIGECAFYKCSSLTSITIPNNVTIIERCTFYECTSLTSVTIPDSVTTIEEGVFYKCSALTKIIIPNGVISIEGGTFNGCSNLTEITIPQSVTNIAHAAFFDCNNLSKIYYAGTEEDWGNITIANNANCTCNTNCNLMLINATKIYINASGTCGDDVTWTLNSEGTLTISGTGAMADYTDATYVPWYSNKINITSVVINDGVTSIGTRAFYGYGTLTSVELGSVTSIGDYAFQNCNALKSVNLGSVTSIGNSVFSGCTLLESADISSVTSMGTMAFYQCKALTSVTIPSGVETISTGTFSHCTSLASLYIPVSVTKFYDDLAGCDALTTVTYDGTSAQWSKVIGSGKEKIPSEKLIFTKFNVTYNGNGNTSGAAPTDSTAYASSVSVTVKDNTGSLAKTGYTFAGWNTEQDGSGTDYAAGATLSITEDTTLYAKWTANKYKVSFDANGGTCASVIWKVTYDGTYGTLQTPTRDGYTFGGWYTAASGGTQVTKDTKVQITSDQTLYAHWTANTYTVTLNVGGGTINAGNITGYTYGEGATLPTNVTKTGYTFGGWYNNSGCTGTAVITISTTDIGDETFYAKWEPISYTITYELNGGSADGNPESYTIESNTFTLNNPTKTGYTFTGWSGTGLTGEDNKSVTIEKGSTGNRSYTAQWTCAHSSTTHTPAQAATCEADGNNEYWTCNNATCGKIFSDEACNTETTAEARKITKLSHNYSYTASGAVITETCDNGCRHSATLTLKAEDKTYSGSAYIGASIEKGSSFVGPEGAIRYVGISSTEYADNTTAPTNAGTYEASVTIGGTTAKRSFTIAPKPLTGAMVTLNDAGNYPFTGSTITPAVTVSDDAATITSDDYTISGSTSATAFGTYELSVTGQGNYTGTVTVPWSIRDPNPPTGSIIVSADSWNNFRDIITSEKFFKEAQTVTITGQDGAGESGIDELYYHISETGFSSESDLENVTNWTKLSATRDTEKTGSFSIPPEGKLIIYAKITDKSGNVAYINSDKIVLDTTAPAITGVEGGKTYCVAQEITVTDKYLDKVTVNGEAVTLGTGGTYTLAAADKTYEIVATDKAGNGTTVTATMKNGHTPVTDEAKAPTCTETGLTAGSHCSVCDDVIVAQTEIPAKGHTEITDAAVAATCTETGLTEGLHCSVCNEVITAQTEIPATGHTEVTDAAVAPTCTEAGLAAGLHCSVCNEVLTAQETVPAKGHTEVTDEAIAPTCTETGLTAGSHCSVCNIVLTVQETVPATGHTEVTDEAVAPTCTETGLTEGSHCSVCNEVLTAQIVRPATGHAIVTDAAKEPTCTEAGHEAGSYCSVCDTVLSGLEVIPATGHMEVTDYAVAATCTGTGLTEGSHCSKCGTVLTEQEIIPAKGHDYSRAPTWDWASGHSGATATFTCKNDGNHKESVDADVTSDTIYSDCTAGGKIVYTASVTYDGYTYTDAEEVAAPATSHNYSSDYTTDREPTCTTEGKKSIHCMVCGAIKDGSTLGIEKIPHTAGGAVTENKKDATCTSGGSHDEVVYCTACRAELSRDTRTDEATGHTPGRWKEKTPATESTEGVEIKTCTVCGEELETRSIEKLQPSNKGNSGTGQTSSGTNQTTGSTNKTTGSTSQTTTSTNKTSTTTNKTTTGTNKTSTTTKQASSGTEKKSDSDAAADDSSAATVPNRVEVTVDEGAPIVEVKPIDQSEVMSNITLTPKEQKAVEKGDQMETVLEVKSEAEENVPEEDKALAEAKAKDDGSDIEFFIDLELLLKNGTTGEIRHITETDGFLTIVIKIPEEIYSDGKNYSVIRIHDNIAENIGGELDRGNRTLAIKTDKFSTYAIVSEDVPAEEGTTETLDTQDTKDTHDAPTTPAANEVKSPEKKSSGHILLIAIIAAVAIAAVVLVVVLLKKKNRPSYEE